MTRLKFRLFAMSFLFIFPCFAHAECKKHGSYFVAEFEDEDGFNSIVKVYKDDGCKASPIYVWDRGAKADNDQFSGLIGDYLGVSEGTDVDGGSLHVVDLKSKKLILSTGEAESRLQDGSVVVFQKIEASKLIDPKTPNCAKQIETNLNRWALKHSPGIRYHLSKCDCQQLLKQVKNAVGKVQYTIDLKSLKRTYSSEAMCSFYQ